MRKYLLSTLMLICGTLFAFPFSQTKECSSPQGWDEISQNWKTNQFGSNFMYSTFFLGTGSFSGTGTGAIPDGGPGCGVNGTALDVSFNVTGLTGDVLEVSVDITMTHTWMGDVTATLIAPDGTTSLVLFGRTGVTASATCGESANLGGTYNFTDAATGGNWWTVSAPLGTSDVMPAGDYRTTAIGPQPVATTSPETSLNTTFSTLADANGTWILRFTDAGGGDTGAVSAANLHIETEEAAPTGCLTGTLYPSITFTPLCVGDPEVIVSDAWAGEYSNVNVTAGTEYTFRCATTTNNDFITIASSDGTTVLASGVSPFVWTANANQVVRFYSHLNDTCATQSSSRVKSVACGEEIIIEEPDFDCFQGDGLAGNGENGYSVLASSTNRTTDDFIVDDTFTMEQVTLFLLTQAPISNVTVNIRNDNAGAPGAVAHTAASITPTSQDLVGAAFGYYVREVVLDLTTPIELTAGTYWLQPEATNTAASNVFWEVTTTGTTGGTLYRSTNSGTTWTLDANGMDAVFFVAGTCELPPIDDDLLVIDLTTENQVTITATSEVSAATISGGTTTGFYFEGLLADAGVQAVGTTTYVGTPTLTAASVPTDNSPSLFRGDSNADPGMNIWGYSSTSTTTFTSGSQAFSGDATWSISPELYAALLTAPEGGNVYFPADDAADISTATLLGTYRVILPVVEPEDGCFVTGQFDQWPTSTYIPSCIGIAETITASAWAGEFSKVQVTAGIEYIFSSSVATDFITIADEDEEIAFITGTGSVTWTSPIDQVIRFYTHADEDCTIEEILRTRAVQCGETPPPPANDDCEDAIALSCGESDSGSTLGANNSGGNPAGDVFYSFTGSGTPEIVTVSLCSSSYDTSLRVFSDCTLTNEVAFNDDFCGLQSQLSFISDGTSTYIIMVEGYDVNVGNYVIDVTCSEVPPPPASCEDNEVLDNGMENGYFFTNSLAVDIPVGDEGYTVEGAYITVAGPATSINFTFYADNSGMPGTQVATANGTIIGSEVIGQNFGFDFIKYNVDFDAGVDFDTNTTYWMQVQSDAEAWDWTSDMSAMIGQPGMIDNGTGWASADGGEFVYQIYCEEMGVSNMNSFDFSYYPNPVKDFLNIESKKAVQSIDAFNLAGQKVMSDMKLTQGKLNISNLTTGAYVFRATLEGGQVETFKVIKK